MYLKQFVGPFYAGKTELNVGVNGHSANSNDNVGEEVYIFMHVGIETPKIGSIPDRANNSLKTHEERIIKKGDFSINGMEYHIPETGILEFEGRYKYSSIHIEFMRDFPPETTLEISYKIQEN